MVTNGLNLLLLRLRNKNKTDWLSCSVIFSFDNNYFLLTASLLLIKVLKVLGYSNFLRKMLMKLVNANVFYFDQSSAQ